MTSYRYSISEFLRTSPAITFCKGRSIKDRLVHSHYEAPKLEGTWLERKMQSTFRCGCCQARSLVSRAKELSSSVTKRTYQKQDFANCKTKGVVYLCKCTCLLDYIGKMKYEFWWCILHVSDIRNRRDTLHPYQDISGTNISTFCVMEVV